MKGLSSSSPFLQTSAHTSAKFSLPKPSYYVSIPPNSYVALPRPLSPVVSPSGISISTWVKLEQLEYETIQHWLRVFRAKGEDVPFSTDISLVSLVHFQHPTTQYQSVESHSMLKIVASIAIKPQITARSEDTGDIGEEKSDTPPLHPYPKESTSGCQKPIQGKKSLDSDDASYLHIHWRGMEGIVSIIGMGMDICDWNHLTFSFSSVASVPKASLFDGSKDMSTQLDKERVSMCVCGIFVNGSWRADVSLFSSHSNSTSATEVLPKPIDTAPPKHSTPHLNEDMASTTCNCPGITQDVGNVCIYLGDYEHGDEEALNNAVNSIFSSSSYLPSFSLPPSPCMSIRMASFCLFSAGLNPLQIHSHYLTTLTQRPTHTFRKELHTKRETIGVSKDQRGLSHAGKGVGKTNADTIAFSPFSLHPFVACPSSFLPGGPLKRTKSLDAERVRYDKMIEQFKKQAEKLEKQRRMRERDEGMSVSFLQKDAPRWTEKKYDQEEDADDEIIVFEDDGVMRVSEILSNKAKEQNTKDDKTKLNITTYALSLCRTHINDESHGSTRIREDVYSGVMDHACSDNCGDDDSFDRRYDGRSSQWTDAIARLYKLPTFKELSHPRLVESFDTLVIELVCGGGGEITSKADNEGMKRQYRGTLQHSPRVYVKAALQSTRENIEHSHGSMPCLFIEEAAKGGKRRLLDIQAFSSAKQLGSPLVSSSNENPEHKVSPVTPISIFRTFSLSVCDVLDVCINQSSGIPAKISGGTHIVSPSTSSRFANNHLKSPSSLSSSSSSLSSDSSKASTDLSSLCLSHGVTLLPPTASRSLSVCGIGHNYEMIETGLRYVCVRKAEIDIEPTCESDVRDDEHSFEGSSLDESWHFIDEAMIPMPHDAENSLNPDTGRFRRKQRRKNKKNLHNLKKMRRRMIRHASHSSIVVPDTSSSQYFFVSEDRSYSSLPFQVITKSHCECITQLHTSHSYRSLSLVQSILTHIIEVTTLPIHPLSQTLILVPLIHSLRHVCVFLDHSSNNNVSGVLIVCMWKGIQGMITKWRSLESSRAEFFDTDSASSSPTIEQHQFFSSPSLPDISCDLIDSCEHSVLIALLYLCGLSVTEEIISTITGSGEVKESSTLHDDYTVFEPASSIFAPLYSPENTQTFVHSMNVSAHTFIPCDSSQHNDPTTRVRLRVDGVLDWATPLLVIFSASSPCPACMEIWSSSSLIYLFSALRCACCSSEMSCRMLRHMNFHGKLLKSEYLHSRPLQGYPKTRSIPDRFSLHSPLSLQLSLFLFLQTLLPLSLLRFYLPPSLFSICGLSSNLIGIYSESNSDLGINLSTHSQGELDREALLDGIDGEEQRGKDLGDGIDGYRSNSYTNEMSPLDDFSLDTNPFFILRCRLSLQSELSFLMEFSTILHECVSGFSSILDEKKELQEQENEESLIEAVHSTNDDSKHLNNHKPLFLHSLLFHYLSFLLFSLHSAVNGISQHPEQVSVLMNRILEGITNVDRRDGESGDTELFGSSIANDSPDTLSMASRVRVFGDTVESPHGKGFNGMGKDASFLSPTFSGIGSSSSSFSSSAISGSSLDATLDSIMSPPSFSGTSVASFTSAQSFASSSSSSSFSSIVSPILESSILPDVLLNEIIRILPMKVLCESAVTIYRSLRMIEQDEKGTDLVDQSATSSSPGFPSLSILLLQGVIKSLLCIGDATGTKSSIPSSMMNELFFQTSKHGTIGLSGNGKKQNISANHSGVVLEELPTPISKDNTPILPESHASFEQPVTGQAILSPLAQHRHDNLHSPIAEDSSSFSPQSSNLAQEVFTSSPPTLYDDPTSQTVDAILSPLAQHRHDNLHSPIAEDSSSFSPQSSTLAQEVFTSSPPTLYDDPTSQTVDGKGKIIESDYQSIVDLSSSVFVEKPRTLQRIFASDDLLLHPQTISLLLSSCLVSSAMPPARLSDLVKPSLCSSMVDHTTDISLYNTFLLPSPSFLSFSSSCGMSGFKMVSSVAKTTLTSLYLAQCAYERGENSAPLHIVIEGGRRGRKRGRIETIQMASYTDDTKKSDYSVISSDISSPESIIPPQSTKSTPLPTLSRGQNMHSMDISTPSAFTASRSPSPSNEMSSLSSLTCSLGKERDLASVEDMGGIVLFMGSACESMISIVQRMIKDVKISQIQGNSDMIKGSIDHSRTMFLHHFSSLQMIGVSLLKLLAIAPGNLEQMNTLSLSSSLDSNPIFSSLRNVLFSDKYHDNGLKTSFSADDSTDDSCHVCTIMGIICGIAIMCEWRFRELLKNIEESYIDVLKEKGKEDDHITILLCLFVQISIRLSHVQPQSCLSFLGGLEISQQAIRYFQDNEDKHLETSSSQQDKKPDDQHPVSSSIAQPDKDIDAIVTEDSISTSALPHSSVPPIELKDISPLLSRGVILQFQDLQTITRLYICMVVSSASFLLLETTVRACTPSHDPEEETREVSSRDDDDLSDTSSQNKRQYPTILHWMFASPDNNKDKDQEIGQGDCGVTLNGLFKDLQFLSLSSSESSNIDSLHFLLSSISFFSFANFPIAREVIASLVLQLQDNSMPPELHVFHKRMFSVCFSTTVLSAVFTESRSLDVSPALFSFPTFSSVRKIILEHQEIIGTIEKDADLPMILVNVIKRLDSLVDEAIRKERKSTISIQRSHAHGMMYRRESTRLGKRGTPQHTPISRYKGNALPSSPVHSNSSLSRSLTLNKTKQDSIPGLFGRVCGSGISRRRLDNIVGYGGASNSFTQTCIAFILYVVKCEGSQPLHKEQAFVEHPSEPMIDPELVPAQAHAIPHSNRDDLLVPSISLLSQFPLSLHLFVHIELFGSWLIFGMCHQVLTSIEEIFTNKQKTEVEMLRARQLSDGPVMSKPSLNTCFQLPVFLPLALIILAFTNGNTGAGKMLQQLLGESIEGSLRLDGRYEGDRMVEEEEESDGGNDSSLSLSEHFSNLKKKIIEHGKEVWIPIIDWIYSELELFKHMKEEQKAVQPEDVSIESEIEDIDPFAPASEIKASKAAIIEHGKEVWIPIIDWIYSELELFKHMKEEQKAVQPEDVSIESEIEDIDPFAPASEIKASKAAVLPSSLDSEYYSLYLLSLFPMDTLTQLLFILICLPSSPAAPSSLSELSFFLSGVMSQNFKRRSSCGKYGILLLLSSLAGVIENKSNKSMVGIRQSKHQKDDHEKLSRKKEKKKRQKQTRKKSISASSPMSPLSMSGSNRTSPSKVPSIHLHNSPGSVPIENDFQLTPYEWIVFNAEKERVKSHSSFFLASSSPVFPSKLSGCVFRCGKEEEYNGKDSDGWCLPKFPRLFSATRSLSDSIVWMSIHKVQRILDSHDEQARVCGAWVEMVPFSEIKALKSMQDSVGSSNLTRIINDSLSSDGDSVITELSDEECVCCVCVLIRKRYVSVSCVELKGRKRRRLGWRFSNDIVFVPIPGNPSLSSLAEKYGTSVDKLAQGFRNNRDILWNYTSFEAISDDNCPLRPHSIKRKNNYDYETNWNQSPATSRAADVVLIAQLHSHRGRVEITPSHCLNVTKYPHPPSLSELKEPVKHKAPPKKPDLSLPPSSSLSSSVASPKAERQQTHVNEQHPAPFSHFSFLSSLYWSVAGDWLRSRRRKGALNVFESLCRADQTRIELHAAAVSADVLQQSSFTQKMRIRLKRMLQQDGISVGSCLGAMERIGREYGYVGMGVVSSIHETNNNTGSAGQNTSEEKIMWTRDVLGRIARSTALEFENYTIPSTQTYDLASLTHIFDRCSCQQPFALEMFFLGGQGIFCVFNNKQDRDTFSHGIIESVFDLNGSGMKTNLQFIFSHNEPSVSHSLMPSTHETLSPSGMFSLKQRDKQDYVNKYISYNHIDELHLPFKTTSAYIGHLLKMFSQAKISVHDFIMELNTLSGRSFLDTSQYPSFPWTLKLYRDAEWIRLDGSGKQSDSVTILDMFRDFRKPMGAQGEDRLEFFKQRYIDTEECAIEHGPYHYGTYFMHSALPPLSMIRLEPFLSIHRAISDRRIDHTGRLFFSVPRFWESNAIYHKQSVGELVPEFFSLPEVFQGLNNVDFGLIEKEALRSEDDRDKSKKQSTSVTTTKQLVSVSDVHLPSWSHNTDEFISTMSNSLECDLSANNINNWVDLVFGCKQRGVEAVKAVNMYIQYLYAGAVKFRKIKEIGFVADTITRLHNWGV
ncbi:hypothetical protein ADUPG1_011412, partial [Aduncisulcus paluster]